MIIVKGFNYFKHFKDWWELVGESFSIDDVPIDHFYCVKKEEDILAFGSLVITNCKNIAIFNNFIINPTIDSKELRTNITYYLNGFLESLALSLGYNNIRCDTHVQKLCDRYKVHGFKVVRENVTRMIKVI